MPACWPRSARSGSTAVAGAVRQPALRRRGADATTQAAAAPGLRKRIVVRRILKYLESIGEGPGNGVRNVYFGHTTEGSPIIVTVA